MLVYVFTALGLWLLAFLPGVLAGLIVAYRVRGKESPILTSGMATQVCFIVSSILIVLLLFRGDFRLLGFKINLHYTLQSLIVSLLVASTITTFTYYTSRKARYEPPFLHENPILLALVACTLAPLGEEILFRGLLEGYLLVHTSISLSIAIPSILFAIIHLASYPKAPTRILILVIMGAFTMGLIASYYRALSESLLPAIVSHSTFNIVGVVLVKIIKPCGYGQTDHSIRCNTLQLQHQLK